VEWLARTGVRQPFYKRHHAVDFLDDEFTL
jgi:hypothetical protein